VLEHLLVVFRVRLSAGVPDAQLVFELFSCHLAKG
jgi:hypothetical protein